MKKNSKIIYAKDVEILTKRDLLERYQATAPSTWILSKNVFDLVGLFDESFARFEDIEFLFRLKQCRVPAYYFADITVKKHEHAENISRISMKTIEARELFLKKHSCSLEKDRRYQTITLLSMGKDALALGERELARSYFVDALHLQPLSLKPWFKLAKTFLPSKKP